MNTKRVYWEIEDIHGVLLDIEAIDLPWPETNKISIIYDWDAALDRLRDLQAVQLTPEQQTQYNQIVERIRAQKDKILALDYTYPDID